MWLYTIRNAIESSRRRPSVYVTISKEFGFSASHRLDGLAADHPCSRLHGHNYTVKVELGGIPDEVGFVVDYRSLDWFKELLDSRYDHRDLNEVLGEGINPTAEHLAYLLAQDLQDWVSMSDAAERVGTIAIAVSETPKTWATIGLIVNPSVMARA
jgi:6-pyruvoyltetrahydropterin/6-carboxytetrahydropterin synthase